MTPEFTASDWFEITGRHWPVAVICGGQTESQGVHEPRLLMGREVVIDRTRYLVTGVDHFAVPHHTPGNPCRHSFGLMVEAARDAQLDGA